MPVRKSTLLKFALPTIAAQVFMSIYSVVDGLFVSNLVSTDALGAVNIVMPLVMIIMAVSAMLSQGGRALVATQIGEGNTQAARSNFTLVLVVALAIGSVISALSLLFLEPLLTLLGSDATLLQYCIEYAIPCIVILPVAMLGMITSAFLIVEGRVGLSSGLSVAGGIINMILDYLLIAVADLGVAGAAYATSIGYAVPAIAGLLFFACNKKGTLRFVRPRWDGRALLKMSTNGLSEMVMMLSGSVITVVMNNVMIRLAGADGVAAISIMVYAITIISSAFYGFNYGVAPICSYNFGKGDRPNIRRFYVVSLQITAIFGVAMLALCEILAVPLVWIFARPENPVFAMAVTGTRLSGLCFLFLGFNDFASSFFTALNDGKTSGIIAFMRTFVLTLVPLVVLPPLLGLLGLWLAMPVAEVLSLAVSFYYLRRYRDKFGYGAKESAAAEVAEPNAAEPDEMTEPEAEAAAPAPADAH